MPHHAQLARSEDKPSPPVFTTVRLARLALGLVLASVFCLGFTCIPGVILAHITLWQFKKERDKTGRTYALFALVIGYLFLVLWVPLWLSGLLSALETPVPTPNG